MRDTFARAFVGDPMFVFLFPDDAGRLAWLRFVMGAMLAMSAPDGCVFTTGDGVPAAIALSPPGKYPPPVSRLLRFVAWPGNWSAGVPHPRLGKAAWELLSVMERLHEKRPHHYVHVLGVHPDHQGKGLGKALLEDTVARADAEGAVAYLETTNPVNLPLYRRFGFEVTAEVTLPGGYPPLWGMTREPPRAAS